MKDPCSELSKVITQLALNIGSRPEVKNLDHVVTEMQKHIPEMTRESLVASINEATTGQARAKSELSKKLTAMKREARRDADLRAAIVGMEKHLEAGTLPEPAGRTTTEAPPVIESLAEKRDTLLSALKKSDPAIRNRFERQIENLTDRLENGVFTRPQPKSEQALSPELQRLEYQRDNLRKQVRREIEAMRPKTIWGRIAEPLNAARAIMTSMDLSAVLRQGGFISLSHPIRSARAIPEMLRAFASDEASYRSAKEIEARPNAPMYAKAKLYLSDVGIGGLSKQEEKFVSALAGKIPLVRASERAYVTFLNRVRADSFDALANGLAKDSAVTMPEAKVLADFVNSATGRARLPAQMEQAADALNTLFFAPRYVASRFALLTGQPMWRGTAATRKAIGAEYARYLAGAGAVLGLGALAGGTIEGDPRSADFGKIKFGNTRIDMFSGLGALVTLGVRTATGQTKTAKGDVRSLSDPKFGQSDLGDTWSSFLRYKLSPPAQLAATLATRKDAMGNKTGPLGAAGEMIAPLSFGEVYENLREHGFAKGSAFSLLSMLGASTNTYDTASKDRRSHFEKDAQALWDKIKD